MPRLKDVIERRDKCHYDTHLMEAGQSIRFLSKLDTGLESRLGHRNTLQVAGQLTTDLTYVILSIGLRLFGKTQDEEDALLDYFTVTPTLGDHPFGPYPGNVCSTLRFLEEKEPLPPEELEPKNTIIDCNTCRSYSPGYILLKPLVLPVRQSFNLHVSASPLLPEATVVRGMVFGLASRDVC